MRAVELLRKFEAKRQPADAHEHLTVFLRTAPPEEVEAFAVDALTRLPAGGTFFHSVLSHVSDGAFVRLIEQAMAALEAHITSDASESVIRYASLQLPHALRPHLSRLFELRPNNGTRCENWPWRGAGPSDLDFLGHQLNSRDHTRRMKAWKCLLETRRRDAISIAIAAAGQLDLEHPLEAYLHNVGFASLDRPLFSDVCAHLIFSQDAFAYDRPSWRLVHPTWYLPGGESVRFGGRGSAACGLCGEPLHHLITIPEASIFSPGSGKAHRQISLETCLSCLGWERPVLFYKHDDDGRAQPLDVGFSKPEFIGDPFQETRVRLAPTPARWTWQDWASSNSRQNLNRFGGYPCWIQSADFPQCRDCEETMRFVMQLDSGLPNEGDGEWLWGSGGICYVFGCSPCRSTAFLWQCT
jgi:hypothetical protein